MNEIVYYIDFSSLTVTVASLKKMQKTFKEKYLKKINKGKNDENG